MQASEPSDVQEIVVGLREEIRRHRTALGELGAIDLSHPLDDVRRYQRVNPHLPIGWPVMPKGLIPKLVAYAKKITRRLLRWYINPLVEQQNDYNAAATEVISALHTRVQEQARTLHEMRAQLQETELEREATRLRLQRLENWRRSGASVDADHFDSSEATPPTQAPSPDLFLLGAKYRNEELVRQWLHEYDDLFAALRDARVRDDEHAPVLDIGCGRGELVAHLNELGLPAYGIDIDRDAIQVGQATGRDVRHADATAHLSGLPDASLSAITMIQVIEHFEVNDLLRLLVLAARKLIPDGLFLAETINPMCVFALVNFYLLDPSHRTPLHPELARLLLEQAGLERVEIRTLHPVPEGGRLEALPEAGFSPPPPWLVQPFNRNVQRLNELLYGSQDYAAIAYKPKE